MPINFIMTEPHLILGNQSTSVTNTTFATMGGIGSWVATSFMAKENIILNRCVFRVGAIAGGTGATLMVGIGTMDVATGQPSQNAGLGNSLNFTTQSLFTGLVTGTNYFASFPDIALTAGTKYFLGLQTVGRLVNTTIVHFVRLFGNSFEDTSNYRVFGYNNSGLSTESSNSITYNWGYDSGSGNTIWYNEYYAGHTQLLTKYSLTSTGSSQNGFTYFMNNDFDAMELEEVGCLFRVDNITPSTGLATTYNCVLYDSDGITALTASTQSYFGGAINNFRHVYMPIKYTLQNRKLYYFAFNREATNSTNTFILASSYPSQIMSGSAFTTYPFTKESPSSSPVIIEGDLIPTNFVFSKAIGSRQGGAGLH